MSVIDKVSVSGISYDIQDSNATALLTDIDSRVNKLDDLVDYGYATAADWSASTSAVTYNASRNGTRLAVNGTLDNSSSYYFIKLNGTVQSGASTGNTGLSSFTPIKLVVGHRYRWEMHVVSGKVENSSETVDNSLVRPVAYKAGTANSVSGSTYTVLPFGGQTAEFDYTSDVDTAGGVCLCLTMYRTNGVVLTSFVAEFILRDVTCAGMPVNPSMQWEQGGIGANDGGKASASNRIRTPDYLHITKRSGLRIIPASGYKCAVRMYNAPTGTDGYTGTLGGNFLNADSVWTVDAGTYLRFVLGASDDSDITPTAASNVQIILYTLEDAVEVDIDTTTVSISAAANHRYVCTANVAQITFTPSASGLCELTFSTGDNPVWNSSAVMPEWFVIASGLNYEMSFLNGRGVVMEWPVT